jgi:hypothetical protein
MATIATIIERHLSKLAPQCSAVSSSDTTYGYSFANVPLETNDPDHDYLQDRVFDKNDYPFKVGSNIIIIGKNVYKGYLGIVTTWVSSDIVMVLLEANGRHLSLNKSQIQLI